MDCLIRFLPSRRAIRLPAGTSVLEAARRVGLPLAQSCGGEGVCGRCGVWIAEGREGVSAESCDETAAKSRNRVDPGLRLACRASIERDVTVVAAYCDPAVSARPADPR